MIPTELFTLVAIVLGIIIILFVLKGALKLFMKVAIIIFLIIIIGTALVGFDMWKTSKAYSDGPVLILNGQNETLVEVKSYTKEDKLTSLEVENFSELYIELSEDNFQNIEIPENFSAIIVFHSEENISENWITQRMFWKKDVYLEPKPRTLSLIRR